MDTPIPSQFSHEILNANPYAYLDDAPLEERRARAVEMRRMLPESVLSEVGRLDPAAIAEVRADAWPDVRDAEELHDALLTMVAIPQFDKRAGEQTAEQNVSAMLRRWARCKPATCMSQPLRGADFLNSSRPHGALPALLSTARRYGLQPSAA